MRSTLKYIVVPAVALAIAGCAPGRPAGDAERPGANWTRPAAEAPAPPPLRDVPIDFSLQQQALDELLLQARQGAPVLRAHAIESLKDVGREEGQHVIVESLTDRDTLVRFAATMAAGEARIPQARPTLRNMVDDPSRPVQVAVRYALHRLGDTTHSHDLEQFSIDSDKSVRANTVVVLGMLQEPSAKKLLLPMMRDNDPDIRLQVAEALWRLGDETALRSLVAMSLSQHPDEQSIAFLALAEPRNMRVIEHVRSGLTTEYNEVRLVAARAMGMLGSDAGYTVATQDLADKDARRRHLAALALGEIGRADAQPLLQPLLRDNDAAVRIAAAKALLQIGARAS